jgi:hypothetical protein
MLLRESLGISADGSEKAFHQSDIEAMIKRVPQQIIYNLREPTDNVNHVFVAVDPSGGGASAFSVASLVQDARGFSHVSHSHTHHSCLPPPPRFPNPPPQPSSALVAATQILLPSGGEHGHQHHETFRFLGHTIYERWYGAGQHAILQVRYKQWFGFCEVVAYRGHCVQRKEQRRAPRRNSSIVVIGCEHTLPLPVGLLKGGRVAARLGPQKHNHPTQDAIKRFSHIIYHLLPLVTPPLAQWRSK